MEDTEVELLRFGEMGHTGHKRLPERPIIGPFREDSVNGGILLANLLQRSSSTFSWGRFPSFFAFKEGMSDT
jgi:hypothetical protein